VNSQKPHSFPSTLTLIHREAVARAVNCHIAVALNRLKERQQITRVLDEREEIIEVLIFICGEKKLIRNLLKIFFVSILG
jgi:hypothetical protein